MAICAIDGTPASGLTFGCMQFGGTADPAASAAMFDACRRAGINHFDSAWLYTGGASERILGRLVAAERDALIVASKVGYEGGAGPANMQAQFDESRTRLALDTIDVLYMHRFDDTAPLEATFEKLRSWQEAGAIRHIGVSNYAAWQVMKAQSVARGLGTRIDVIQPMYSLVKRQAEVELLPMAADQGIFIAPYSPLGGGLLTGKYAAGGEGRLTSDPRYQARYGADFMHRAAEGLNAIATREGVHPATLAVAWAASHEAGPAPIISGRSVAQLQPSLAAADFALSAQLRAEMTALTPTPAPATDRLEEA